MSEQESQNESSRSGSAANYFVPTVLNTEIAVADVLAKARLQLLGEDASTDEEQGTVATLDRSAQLRAQKEEEVMRPLHAIAHLIRLDLGPTFSVENLNLLSIEGTAGKRREFAEAAVEVAFEEADFDMPPPDQHIHEVSMAVQNHILGTNRFIPPPPPIDDEEL